MQQGEHCLTPTTEYINRAAVQADELGLGVAFIHSHPNPEHPPTLSNADILATVELFENLNSILPSKPLASLVFTSTSFGGIAFTKNRARIVDRIRLLGPTIQTLRASGTTSHPRPTTAELSIHDRQIMALGREGQEQISGARVAIVGLGGTGSCVAEQLIRLGVKELWLVDDDILEESNLSRVYGSTPRNVVDKTPKVQAVANHLSSISSNARLFPIKGNILEYSVKRNLIGLDLIVGCTDTHGSRAELNELAYQHYVPVIDTGCAISIEKDQVVNLYARIRHLRPGIPCLWCTDSLDGTRILEESLDPEDRTNRANEGYGSGVGPQPSIIHLTTVTAGLAVNEVLRQITGLGNPDICELHLNLTLPTLTAVQSSPDPSCICHRYLGKGLQE